MHTIVVPLPSGQTAYVNHNPDWSGEAIITWPGREVRLPGEVVRAIALQAGMAAIRASGEDDIDRLGRMLGGAPR